MSPTQTALILDRMIDCRRNEGWVDDALCSNEPERWRLALAEMLEAAGHACDCEMCETLK